jgi:beta-galactosidase
MSDFSIHNQQFNLDGQPFFIQAGEFHYFRAPADQWAHRLNLLRKAGFNTVATYIPWLWHQPQRGVSDLDGHTHPMKNLAGFLDLAAQMGFFIIARPGPYIMAETINEGIPPWVFSENPQCAFISQDGKTQNIASYMHPDFLKNIEAWYEAVFAVLSPRQITRGGKILMVQLDNEMGMLQWVRNIVDINPDTLNRFANFLEEKNPASTRPSAESLREGICRPDSAFLVEEYRRFYRAYLRDYAATLWDMAKAQGMDVPPVINIHGFGNGGKTFPIGLSQLVEAMSLEGAVSATDVYPIFIGEGNFHQLLLVNEMTKALQNPNQALFSIEFQAGGNNDFSGAQTSLYDLHSRLCISCGMRAVNHYLFFDGENDPVLSPTRRHDWGHPVRKDGTTRKHYARYAALSSALSAYGDDLVKAKPKTVTTVGFLLDQFMTEVNNAFTEEGTKIITHQRDVILFDFIARGLAITHRPFDALEVSRASLNVETTPLLWMMMEKQCNEAEQQKLVAYVRAGGKLVLIGRMPEETFERRPCSVLKEALGVESVTGGKPYQHEDIRMFGHENIPVSFAQSYAGRFDEVFASRKNGETTGFIQALGMGRVLVLGAALTANTLDDLDVFDQMANKMNCAPLFRLNEWLDARLSESERGSFLFINNYQDDRAETTLSVAGHSLPNEFSVPISARRGAILPIEWRVRPGIIIHYITAEIVDVSEREGQVLIKTACSEFFAEISLEGYHCSASLIVQRINERRVMTHIKNSIIVLMKNH